MNEMSIKKFLVNAIEVIATAAILSLILIKFILMPIEVEGSSMYPTLVNGQRGYSFIITRNININRFDIAIIQKTSSKDLLVKRVIGMPNETIECVDNIIYINGEAIKQDFLESDVVTDDFDLITLGPDEYFCLGDNRDVSVDSRVYGPFKKEKILATHAFIYNPLSDLGYRK